MTKEECMQKLSAISNYCCAQKDKDALDMAIDDIKKLEKISQLYNEWKNDYRVGTGSTLDKIGEIL